MMSTMGCMTTFRTSHRGEGLVWIALVELRRAAPNIALFRGAGAFGNVVGIAVAREAFMENVVRWFDTRQAIVVGMEDVEPLDERLRRVIVDAEILASVRWLIKEGDVEIATLDTYATDDA
jgi:hypothetical protein